MNLYNWFMSLSSFVAHNANKLISSYVCTYEIALERGREWRKKNKSKRRLSKILKTDEKIDKFNFWCYKNGEFSIHL